MKKLVTVEREDADIFELFMINSIKTLFRQNREKSFIELYELFNHDLAKMNDMYSILSKFNIKTTSDSILIFKASDDRFIAQISERNREEIFIMNNKEIYNEYLTSLLKSKALGIQKAFEDNLLFYEDEIEQASNELDIINDILKIIEGK